MYELQKVIHFVTHNFKSFTVFSFDSIFYRYTVKNNKYKAWFNIILKVITEMLNL